MKTASALFWNSQESRPRALWRLLALLVLLVTLITIFGLALAVLLAGVGGIYLSSTFLVQAAYGAIITLLATAVSLWLAGRFLDHRPFADFGFHVDKSWWMDLGFGLSLGALIMAGIFVAEWAAGWLTITGTFRTIDPGQPFALAILPPIVLFICVGIYEEMLSRGYLLLNLAEGLNFPAIGSRGAIVLAWVLSSAIFGLAHSSNPNADAVSTVSLIAAGIFLGLGYVLTGELAIPIGLHITWNFFEGNVFGFPVSGGTFSQATFIAIRQSGPDLWTGGVFGPEAGLVSILAMLVGGLVILLWVRARRGTVAVQTALATFHPRSSGQAST